MRTLLLSTAIIFGLVSHASAAKCPTGEKLHGVLTEFLSNNAEIINSQWDEKAKISDKKIQSASVDLRKLLSDDAKLLTVTESKLKDRVACEYQYNGKDLLTLDLPIK